MEEILAPDQEQFTDEQLSKLKLEMQLANENKRTRLKLRDGGAYPGTRSSPSRRRAEA